MSREIPLTRGLVALVDDVDYEALTQYKWRASLGSWTNYARRCKPGVRGRCLHMHREIIDAPAHLAVDHINRNGLDNRRCNLRLCTQSQNMANAAPSPNKSSRYKGVALHRASGLWTAKVQHERKPYCLGYFKDEISAAVAYDRAALEIFGEFALLNQQIYPGMLGGVRS